MSLQEVLYLFPSGDQLDTTAMLLAAIASGNKGVKLKSFDAIQGLVNLNIHRKIPVGDAFTAERETSVSVSKGDSTGITGVTIDEEVFIAAVGEAHSGIYEATFDGAVWHKENGENIVLSDYGISVTGTPVEGDHIIVTEMASSITFDVVDHDKDCAADEHSIVLLSRDVVAYGTIPFDAPELMYYTSGGMSAGTYRFTLLKGAYNNNTGSDGTYVFTLSQDIPAGGGFRHSTIGQSQSDGYTKAQITGGTITTYGAQPARAVVESNISVSEWDGSSAATNIGTFTSRDAQYLDAITDVSTHNFTERQRYGSNRYSQSAARQWLNSSGKAVQSGDTTVSYWWSPQNVFDMPPNGATLAGFLHGLDPSLVAVLGTATIVCSMPDPDRTAGLETSETLHDKVFLPSMTEIYSGNNISIAEGSQYDYYSGTDNAAKIKYQGVTARYWWLRSARPGTAYHVRDASPSGALNHDYAYHAHGLVPGLIIKSKIA